MNYRKFLKYHIKEIDQTFQLFVENSNGKLKLMKTFTNKKDAEKYRNEWMNG
jgi:hypothetical protein